MKHNPKFNSFYPKKHVVLGS